MSSSNSSIENIYKSTEKFPLEAIPFELAAYLAMFVANIALLLLAVPAVFHLHRLRLIRVQ